MKSNYLIWVLAGVVVLLGVWYWTNQKQVMAPSESMTEESQTMTDEHGDEMMQEDSSMQDDAMQKDDAMMKEDASGSMEATDSMMAH